VIAEGLTTGVAVEERRKHFQRQRRRNEERVALERSEDQIAQLAGDGMILGNLRVVLDARRLVTRRHPAVDPFGGVETDASVAHLILGLWGIVASRNFGSAKTYAQIAGVVYLVLAVLGFVDPTGFGLLPLGGADIALHAVLGIILAGVGFTAKPGRAATA